MARSWHYPRWRRVLMQITMWLLLGGTVALAAWVSRDRNHSPRVALAQKVAAGPLRVRFPGSWAVSVNPGRNALITASPPDDDDPGARLSVRVLAVADDRTPGDYLLGPDGLLRDGTDSSDDPSGPGVKAIRMGMAPGVMVRLTTTEITAAGAVALDRWFACGIFPGHPRRAVLLELDVPRDPTETAPDATDEDEHEQLLRSIAASVQLIPRAGDDSGTAI